MKKNIHRIESFTDCEMPDMLNIVIEVSKHFPTIAGRSMNNLLFGLLNMDANEEIHAVTDTSNSGVSTTRHYVLADEWFDSAKERIKVESGEAVHLTVWRTHSMGFVVTVHYVAEFNA